jgi:hypothetical protein
MRMRARVRVEAKVKVKSQQVGGDSVLRSKSAGKESDRAEPTQRLFAAHRRLLLIALILTVIMFYSDNVLR